MDVKKGEKRIELQANGEGLRCQGKRLRYMQWAPNRAAASKPLAVPPLVLLWRCPLPVLPPCLPLGTRLATCLGLVSQLDSRLESQERLEEAGPVEDQRATLNWRNTKEEVATPQDLREAGGEF
ncbi:Scavenger Receptor Cysteine-Rich Domain-Containing Protein Scart1 [Manis pentadactyla]|nr:Scavenger Receptor Cysteine-Rich Domain-Containing Protein Scart1 [Manis pentadactyla]